MRSYIVQTKPNYENKVKEGFLKKKESLEYKDVIGEVFSPEEKVTSFKNGQKVESVKKFFPGYLIVEMEHSEALWYELKKISGLVGFVGGDKTKPSVISEKELSAIRARMDSKDVKPKVQYEIEQKVFINSGNFKDFYGIVKEVKYDKNKVKVAISVFNRETIVEMGLDNIEVTQ